MDSADFSPVQAFGKLNFTVIACLFAIGGCDVEVESGDFDEELRISEFDPEDSEEFEISTPVLEEQGLPVDDLVQHPEEEVDPLFGRCCKANCASGGCHIKGSVGQCSCNCDANGNPVCTSGESLEEGET